MKGRVATSIPGALGRSVANPLWCKSTNDILRAEKSGHMKLSEALVLRADIQKRLQRLHQRVTLSVLVQEGEQPPEDPQELFAELNRLLAQFVDLVDRINRTNVV